MDISKLLGLRPKVQTAESIAAAIAQAEAQQAQAVAREAELKAGRGALLVSGSAKEVEAGERELAEVRGEMERLAVMIEALKPQLVTFQKQEKVADWRKKVEDANNRADEIAAIFAARFPILEKEMNGLHSKMREVGEEIRELRFRLAGDPEMTREIGNYGTLLDDCYERVNRKKRLAAAG